MSDRVARTPSADKPELFDLARDVIRRKHYCIRTGQANIDWIKRFRLDRAHVPLSVGRHKPHCAPNPYLDARIGVSAAEKLSAHFEAETFSNTNQ
jgi:hypothetical protein